VGQFGAGSPKLERLTSRMRGRLKRRTLNDLADRDSHRNWDDLWHISAGIPCFCSLDEPPKIGRNANFAIVARFLICISAQGKPRATATRTPPASRRSPQAKNHFEATKPVKPPAPRKTLTRLISAAGVARWAARPARSA